MLKSAVRLLDPRILGVDMYLLICAFPLFLAFGWPLLGWVAAAAIWMAQRLLQVVVMRRVRPYDDPKKVLGFTGMQILTRGWGAMLAVFLVGAYDRSIGLSAAITILVLFTAYFTQKLFAHYGSLGSGGDYAARRGSG